MDLQELRLDLEQREGKARPNNVKAETALVKVEPKVEGVTEGVVVEVTLEEGEDDRDFESDEGLEATLTDSMSLLQDCNNLLIALSNPLIHRRITYYMQQEISRVTGETSAFLESLKGVVEVPESQASAKEEFIEAEFFNIYD